MSAIEIIEQFLTRAEREGAAGFGYYPLLRDALMQLATQIDALDAKTTMANQSAAERIDGLSAKIATMVQPPVPSQTLTLPSRRGGKSADLPNPPV